MIQRVMLFSRYVGYGFVTAVSLCTYHAYHTIDDCSAQLQTELKEIEARRAELEELEHVLLAKENKRRRAPAGSPSPATA